MRTKEEMLELLDDTVKFYSEDVTRRALERSYGSGQELCQYLTSDGKKCAVGRWIDPDCYNVTIEGTSFRKGLFEYLLVPEKQGFPEVLWEILQGLHDNHNFWNTSGLSELGKGKVEEIKKYIQGLKYEK